MPRPCCKFTLPKTKRNREVSNLAVRIAIMDRLFDLHIPKTEYTHMNGCSSPARPLCLGIPSNRIVTLVRYSRRRAYLLESIAEDVLSNSGWNFGWLSRHRCIHSTFGPRSMPTRIVRLLLRVASRASIFGGRDVDCRGNSEKN